MSRKYEDEFIEIRAIGVCGGFSTVFKAISNTDCKLYAIKKIAITSEEMTDKAMQEMRILRTLNADFIVNYIDWWIEDNYYVPFNSEYNLNQQSALFRADKTKLLHIQMEVCSMSLTDLIKQMKFKKKNKITPEKYGMACDILAQLLDCVHHLHEQKPPIVHRNLKPENIMIINDNKNLKKVKLTDFGLSAYHDYVDQSCAKYIGKIRYRDPEADCGQCGAEADIYSLGIIIEQLFNINHNRDSSSGNYSEIHSKYENIKQICLQCISRVAKQRPDCIEIINKKYLWYFKQDKHENCILL